MPTFPPSVQIQGKHIDVQKYLLLCSLVAISYALSETEVQLKCIRHKPDACALWYSIHAVPYGIQYKFLYFDCVRLFTASGCDARGALLHVCMRNA